MENRKPRTLKILLIEDEPDYRFLLREGLAAARTGRFQFEIYDVESLVAGLDFMSHTSVDAVLLDLNLPDGNGLPTFHRLHERFPKIPVIILSAVSDETVAHQAVTEGAQDYLVKGEMSPKLMGRSIGYAIDRKQSQEVLIRMAETLEQRVIERTQDLRNLAAHIESIREEERTSLARQLHDEMGQQLTGLKMDLIWLQKKLALKDPSITPALLKRIESSTDLLDQTIQGVRKISSELRPPLLDDIGLADALRWQATEFQNRTGIKTSFISRTPEVRPAPEKATVIFRVYQELLTNVARHAKAGQVEIRLESSKDQLVLEIHDDGQGITQAQVTDSRSLGILGLKERALIVGGEIRFESKPGGGTTAILTTPLSESERSSTP